MKHYIYIFLLLLVAGLFSGCKKYLEVQPDDALVVPKTISDLQALLDNSNKMNIQRTPGFGEASSDDYFLPDEEYDNIEIEPQRIYTWDVKEYLFQNDWSIAYEPVFIANLCLEQLDKIHSSKNTPEWNQVRGSALYFRSYYFQQLLWVFSESAKALHETIEGCCLRIACTHVSVYAQIR